MFQRIQNWIEYVPAVACAESSDPLNILCLQSKNILPAELSAEEREKNEKQEDSIAEKEDDNDDPDDGITYDPTQYEDLRYRMDTPPPDWEEDHSKETSRTASHNASQTTDKQNEMESTR